MTTGGPGPAIITKMARAPMDSEHFAMAISTLYQAMDHWWNVPPSHRDSGRRGRILEALICCIAAEICGLTPWGAAQAADAWQAKFQELLRTSRTVPSNEAAALRYFAQIAEAGRLFLAFPDPSVD